MCVQVIDIINEFLQYLFNLRNQLMLKDKKLKKKLFVFAISRNHTCFFYTVVVRDTIKRREVVEQNQKMIDPFTIIAVLISCRANWYTLTKMMKERQWNNQRNVPPFFFFYQNISFCLAKERYAVTVKRSIYIFIKKRYLQHIMHNVSIHI